MSSNSSGMNLASNQQTTRATSNILNNKPSQSGSLQQLQPKGATKKISLKHDFINANSLSSSETDLFTSTENLSIEQRFVLRNTPRIEPQGQETFEEHLMPINENKTRHTLEQRFSSNASSDSLRYASVNRSLSEARTPIYAAPTTSSISNRNSLKESSSNRSSVDVSTGSYNTLIIHNDENMYMAGGRDISANVKKDRPRSCGEQGVQEISEIPDDYLNKSQVLKHLANEMKIPNKMRSDTRDSRASEGKIIREKSKLNLIIEDIESPNKSKSKSLPDLTNISDIADVNVFETLLKENAILKKKLLMCGLKVAKTKQLEGEVANIYQVYEELVQSCNRRERLERMARMQLKENLQKVQSLNRALKAKVDLFQTPLSENQFIEPLFNQYKELLERKERQDVELTAQQATLQEQRRHIGILDAALNNAQSQCRHLEEELRKKQMYIERLTQMIGVPTQNKQCDRRMRLDIETELSKESNRSGSSTGSEQKWQLDNRLNSDKRSFDEKVLSPTSSKLSLEKIQETEKIIAEAKQEKLRYMEEAHCAQRKVTDLQSHLKNLEGKMAEKDAFIRAIKNQKKCSSFDSYNLSSESFGLNGHLFATQQQFNSNNTSFKSGTASLSLLDPSPYAESSQKTYNSAMTGVLTTGNYDQSTSSSYNQNLNIQSPSISGNYSPNGSNYSNNFDQNLNFIVQKSPGFNISAFDNQYEDKQNNESLSKFETLQRGLCCLPSLGNKKFTQPLLSDEVSILSTNNSNSFLQTLTHLDPREISRNHEKENLSNKNKTDEIVLLEKQGRCSQKNRNNISGNLAQVTQSVGQNMTDISNIGVLAYQGNPTLTCPPRKERGKSLPPSALPRPPRHPKVQKNNEYERLSDSTKNVDHHQHNPSLDNRNFPTKHILTFPKNGQLLQGRDYGSVDINGSSRFMFKTSNVFTKPIYNQTKNCFQRPDPTKTTKVGQDDTNSTLKRSLLPAARKITSPAANCNPAHNTNINNNNNNNTCNNSINNNKANNNNNNNNNNNARSSSISNNSNQSVAASSVSTSNYKSESSSVSKSSRLQSRTPPKAFQYGNQIIDAPFKSLLPVPHSSTPLLELKGDKSKLHRSSRTSKTGENNYRIQF